MEFLGIGPLELVFILVIILIVAGPNDLARIARTLGRALNRLYRSSNYQIIRRASQELRTLPQKLAQEAQLEELNELKELGKELQDTANTINAPEKAFKAWVEPAPPPAAPANAQPASSAPATSPPSAPPDPETAPTVARQPTPEPASKEEETLRP